MKINNKEVTGIWNVLIIPFLLPVLMLAIIILSIAGVFCLVATILFVLSLVPLLIFYAIMEFCRGLWKGMRKRK